MSMCSPISRTGNMGSGTAIFIGTARFRIRRKGSLWKGPYHLPRCLMICEQLLGFLEEGKPVEPVL